MDRKELASYRNKATGDEKWMAEELFRLKYNYIPQLKMFLESRGPSRMFPHMLKERKLNWIQRLLIKIFW